MTDGLELNQLWNEFQVDARSSYRLYSQNIDASPKAGIPKRKQWWNVAKQFFWAIM